MDCIFCKIIKKEIPADIVYEDDQILAFKDRAPSAPVHILFVPKKHIQSLVHADKGDESMLGHLLLSIAETAKKLGCLAQLGRRLHLHVLHDWSKAFLGTILL